MCYLDLLSLMLASVLFWFSGLTSFRVILDLVTPSLNYATIRVVSPNKSICSLDLIICSDDAAMQ